LDLPEGLKAKARNVVLRPAPIRGRRSPRRELIAFATRAGSVYTHRAVEGLDLDIVRP
jgi:hypothetical protein